MVRLRMCFQTRAKRIPGYTQFGVWGKGGEGERQGSGQNPWKDGALRWGDSRHGRL